MTSFLVQLDGRREVGRHELDQPRLILGRDSEEADLVVQELGVSRRHALLERRHGTTVLTDLGSSNGTFLNGQLVSGSVSVQSGDEIHLANNAFRYLEEAEEWSLGWIVSTVVILLLLGLAGSQLLSRFALRSEDVVVSDSLRDATELAEAGVAAWKRGELSKTKRQIKAAYWTIYRSDLLKDAPAGQVWELGMRRLSDSLGGEVDLAEIFEDVTKRLERVQQVEVSGEGRPACRLDRVEGPELAQCVEAYVRYVMRELRQSDEGIPPWFYKAVGVRLREERGSMKVRLNRGEQYVPAMRRTLQEAKMPPLLNYLAMAESGYRPKVTSPAGARGLWQFMPRTGKAYKLKVDRTTDERTHPEKSTRAAAEYLKRLTFDFGGDSLLLALAGYNKGENGVRRALYELEDPFADRSYWSLVEKGELPEETNKYVSRIFANALAGEGGIPPPGRLEAAGY